MIKKILYLGVLLISSFMIVGCFNPEDGFERVIEGDFVVLVYNLDVWPDRDYVHIEDLSEAGKQKRIIIVPEFLCGRRVDGFKHNVAKGGPSNARWESEVLEKIYIISGSSLYRRGRFLIVDPLYCPNLAGVFYLNQNIDELYSDFLGVFNYYSRKINENYQYSRLIANVSYYWNYDECPNEGYYWLDNYDYATLITDIPEDPVREGYIFNGWYKDEACQNQWDFETDTLPVLIYDEDDEIVYQETILYAKWMAE